MRTLQFPAALTVSLALAACGRFGQQAEVSIMIPDSPPPWVSAFPDLSFVLSFPDSRGRWQSLTVADRKEVISCSKVGNTPILAYPVARRAAGLLRPAGGLYPADLLDQGARPRLELSWKRGCLALIFARLCERGLDTSLVNSARLADSLEKYADPWTLDLDAIVENLVLGDFDAYDIDALPARDVSLRPGAGEWFLESPFATPRMVTEGEVLAVTGLTLGMHALFSVQGETIRIWVGERETVIGQPE